MFIARQGPINDILGYPAQIQQFVARSANAVVALQHVIAFPEGCCLVVHVVARRDLLDESAWNSLRDPVGRSVHVAANANDLQFSVRRPDAKLLSEISRESSSDDSMYESDRRLWLQPLPSPGPFVFTIEWTQMGISAAVTLDGKAIVSAARQAQPYWP